MTGHLPPEVQALLDAVNAITVDPAKPGKLAESLLGIATTADVGSGKGKISLLYSGTISVGEKTIEAYRAAKDFAAQSPDIRIIDKTVAGQFLGSDTLATALASKVAANLQIDPKTATAADVARIGREVDALFKEAARTISANFVRTAGEDIVALVQDFSADSVFASTEVQELLDSRVQVINGLAKSDFPLANDIESALQTMEDLTRRAFENSPIEIIESLDGTKTAIFGTDFLEKISTRYSGTRINPFVRQNLPDGTHFNFAAPDFVGSVSRVVDNKVSGPIGALILAAAGGVLGLAASDALAAEAKSKGKTLTQLSLDDILEFVDNSNLDFDREQLAELGVRVATEAVVEGILRAAGGPIGLAVTAYEVYENYNGVRAVVDMAAQVRPSWHFVQELKSGFELVERTLALVSDGASTIAELTADQLAEFNQFIPVEAEILTSAAADEYVPPNPYVDPLADIQLAQMGEVRDRISQHLQSHFWDSEAQVHELFGGAVTPVKYTDNLINKDLYYGEVYLNEELYKVGPGGIGPYGETWLTGQEFNNRQHLRTAYQKTQSPEDANINSAETMGLLGLIGAFAWNTASPGAIYEMLDESYGLGLIEDMDLLGWNAAQLKLGQLAVGDSIFARGPIDEALGRRLREDGIAPTDFDSLIEARAEGDQGDTAFAPPPGNLSYYNEKGEVAYKSWDHFVHTIENAVETGDWGVGNGPAGGNGKEVTAEARSQIPGSATHPNGGSTVDGNGRHLSYSRYDGRGTFYSGGIPSGTGFKSGTSFQNVRDSDGNIVGVVAIAPPPAAKKSSNNDSGGSGKPIALDLDGDGLELVPLGESSAFFDINGDGYRNNMGWVEADDGFLVVDLDGSGDVNRSEELVFGLLTEEEDTDLEALATVFNTDGNTVLDKRDDRWLDFRIWQDLDQDGVSDKGELKTLAEMGIVSLSLESDGQVDAAESGNLVLGSADFHWTDGTSGTLYDLVLSASDQGYKSVAVDGGIEINLPDEAQVLVADELHGPLTLDLAHTDYAGVFGGAADDMLSYTGDGGVVLHGADGSDVLTGGGGDDWIAGGEGADQISGGDGHDILFIDALDTVDGGSGFDVAVLTGEQGVTLDLAQVAVEGVLGSEAGDTVSFAGTDSITVDGRGGDDTITGGEGDDTLAGGEGTDTVSGGAGNDTVIADANDTVSGGEGADALIFTDDVDRTINITDHGFEILKSGGGNDTLSTDYDQRTFIYAGDGNDLVLGGAGGDELAGERGDDTLEGAYGDDRYVFKRGDGQDTIVDWHAHIETYTRSDYQRGYAWEQPRYDGETQQLKNRNVVYVNKHRGNGTKVRVYYEWTRTLYHDVVVDDMAGDDTLALGPGIVLTDLLLQRSGGDLVIAIRNPDDPDQAFDDIADKVTLKDFDKVHRRVEFVEFADGSKYDLRDLSKSLGVEVDGPPL